LTDVVADVDVVVTMLTNGDALRAVLLEAGALEAMRPGATLVDLSTVDVGSSEAIAAAAAARGVHYVRGAVSGTPPVVRAGTASLLLSGPVDALDAAAPVLSDITTVHSVVGAAEEARVVKIAVNSMLGGTMLMLAEAVAMAEASGVDRRVFLDALGGTVISSRFVAYKSAALLAKDYAPTFTTSDMTKDMQLARDQGEAVGVPMGIAVDVIDALNAGIEAGYGPDDFGTLLCVVQQRAGRPVDLPK
jgi:3-hydroxyisobutyrate dehydrogenase-like beta-hydroxyacid dehydrogenase